ncbi:MAG: MoxR family ATPase [Elusimicrobia bacterium]|nr:MoxR family ATPase [Elusimicrobiota bacterium]
MTDSVKELENRITSVVRGKDRVVRQALACVFAEGHLLIEDVPGVGKTILALSLAKTLGLSLQRIQFTADLLPTDILGVSVFNPRDQSFEFKPGPIFHNVVLADEINRSSPKTQSALLEAMSERQVTTDQTTRPLPHPFFVIATQNPHEHHGTFPLPESQKDRFLMRVTMGYPDPAHELEILRNGIDAQAAERLAPVADAVLMRKGIESVRAVRVDPALDEYVLALVRETRESPFLELGASPRGALALRRSAQANAFLEGRDYVLADDIKSLAVAVLAHRVVPRGSDGEPESEAARRVVEELLARVPVPL